jgi:hypothetical protein
VRDLIVALYDMLGLAVVQNPTHTRQTDGKRLQIERKTIVKPTSQILYSPLVGEAVTVATDCAKLNEKGIPSALTAVERHLLHATTGKDETEMTNERDYTGEEVNPGEALMTYLMVMRNLVVAGAEGLIVISKVRAAEETPRFVAPLKTYLPTTSQSMQMLDLRHFVSDIYAKHHQASGSVPLLCIKKQEAP